MSEQENGSQGEGGAVRTVKLRISSRREFLDSVHNLSQHLIEEVGFASDDSYWMVTAVREAVTNAVIHGNKERPGTNVDVRFDLGSDSIRITVTDQGEGFDPESLPDPVSKEHLMDSSGRGIFLMNQLMDEVSYAFPRDGGTTISMMRRIRSETAEVDT